MNFKTKKNERWGIHWILLAMITLCFAGCKDDDDPAVKVYDPSQPVVVTSFTPSEGGTKTRMVVTGSNFGTDPKIITVRINGMKAPVISAKGTLLYCMVPSKCGDGKVEVTVGDTPAVASEQVFTYDRSKVVSTIYGNVRSDGFWAIGPNGSTFDDSFKNYYCVDAPTWFSVDPQDPTILYMTQDNEGGSLPIRKFDMKKKTVEDVITGGVDGVHRMRTVDWTIEGDTMFVSNDNGSDGDAENGYIALYYLTREEKFKIWHKLAMGKQCNGVAVHPENGELYYGSYYTGSLYRLAYQSYWDDFTSMELPEYTATHREHICNVGDVRWEFNIVVHPSGDYAYLVVINQHYIMRMNYDRARKRFGRPFVFAGSREAGWEDKVGTSARMKRPYQGVFVKNPNYTEGTDQYDFYFTDSDNQCIRTLSPTGLVTTFAGRGSTGLNGDAHGYVDGELREEARFHRPQGLSYDAVNDIFYVGDRNNHRIRMIARETLPGDELKENN